MGRLDKIKRELMEESNKRLLNEQEENNTITDKEVWKSQLLQSLYDVIENKKNEWSLDKGTVNVSDEDVADVLQDMVNTIDPIENHYDKKSGSWYGHSRYH